MARPREPVNLIIAKGKKHLTKAEIEARQNEEITPCTDDLTPPAYLTAAEKRRFEKLANQLVKIKIMGETDVETLARYISAQTLYEKATKDLRDLQKQRPKDADASDLVTWANLLDTLDKRQDRYFKQATASARELGLTISSRCKLVTPATTEAPPENKFSKFRKIGGA